MGGAPIPDGDAMRRVATLYKSTIGKKIMMATTGVVLVGFVLGHMIGNLKALQGAEKIDAYGEFLREMGSPILGHGQGLWLVRIFLIIAVVVHVTAALQLTRRNQLARPAGYAHRFKADASTYASRTMVFGGVFLLGFIVFHLLHLTVGSVHPDFEPGGVYHNLQVAFQAGWTVAFYVLAMVALGFHLFHGIWSGFQTLGLNHARYNRYRRPLAVGLAVVVAVGFMVIPISIFTGILS
jgi:succinate dehydrogenase / fumarate reductase cytochrome b subunit